MSTCARAALDLREPLAGTAATARTWLLIEQPGPWGARALTASRLDAALGAALEAAAEGTGVRVALIRRPGGRPAGPGGPRVVAAHTLPGRTWTHTARLPRLEALRSLDLPALGAGDPASFDALGGAPYDGPPLALVCTNGKRDRCCALLGRPLAEELALTAPEEVWETTHLGGHRFSPTLLVLPHGYAYGRAVTTEVKEILRATAAGEVVVDGCRGRSCWDRPGQAAELALRERLPGARPDDLAVTGVEGAATGWEVALAHRDGRRWRVTVAEGTSLPPRPESCGGTPGTPRRMDVVAVREE
ncbi:MULTISPECIES: sucrase ferredoxin [Streptomyces]|uniref:Sucrase ferredoxin n=2 Tax=Streptomyces diastaticus group TaxID=2849069 RepID=A0ABQ1CUX1_STRDI|nr:MULTISPECIES: sucrase ferredoxin [Streptomyces]PJM80740.1 sucrase ferredoxin [Streptomyces sp. TSRI0384-2]QNE83589.1 sucrase ferredoxin [Streptomyces rutgersensis]RPK86674.1 Sucrase/ferredoxin-like protein [Streptomyces sp. ADI98-12]GFH74123.1 sucrase ferredoxin [Streptomyces diastaticus subsp. diastaticus]GGU43540.1 sucrase ferredoxin [Streptomyces diastaticus subsp. diastaticus]